MELVTVDLDHETDVRIEEIDPSHAPRFVDDSDLSQRDREIEVEHESHELRLKTAFESGIEGPTLTQDALQLGCTVFGPPTSKKRAAQSIDRSQILAKSIVNDSVQARHRKNLGQIGNGRFDGSDG